MNLEGRSIYSDLFKADTTIYYHLNNYNQIYTISANNLTPQLYAVIPEQASNDRIPAEEVVLPEDRLAYCKKNNLYEDVMNFNVLHNGHTIYAEMYTFQNMDLLLYNIDNGKTYRIDDGLPQRIFGNDRNTQYKFLTVSSLPELMQDEKIKNNKYLYDQISEIASFVKEDDNPIVVEIEIKKKA